MSSVLRDAALRGSAHHMSAVACSRLARAFGTLLRRHTGTARHRVIVCRTSAGEPTPLVGMRDGIVAGLVLCGHDVKDAGIVADAGAFEAAMRRHDCVHGALATADGDGFALVFMLAGRTVGGDAMLELAALADSDELSAGEGSLEIVG